MTDLALRDDNLISLQRHSWIGLVAVCGLCGGLLLWANTAKLDGAIIADGQIVVESYSKQVQHLEGGTVREILARNEDVVAEGQVLLRLDDTALRADLAVAQWQLNDALIREARLTAEVAGADTMPVPGELAGEVEAPDIAALLMTQRQALDAQRAARTGQIAQLNEQVVQLERQIEGLQVQSDASDRQIELVTSELADLNKLLENQLVANSRIRELSRQLAMQQGESGRLTTTIAAARAAIAERKLQMNQITDEAMVASLDLLQQTRLVIAELRQRILTLEDRLRRTEIKAPQAGMVHNSTVHTVGGVVGAGEVLMQIVPQDDTLVVGIGVKPIDIDKVQIGQEVEVRIAGFDHRSTPSVIGHVLTMSPDLVRVQEGLPAYYTARVALDEESLAGLPDGAKLVPGMPVQAFIVTGERSVLAYLVEPFAQQFRLALRED